MARHKDGDWNLPDVHVQTWEQAGIAVLMDIRDELKALNKVIGCRNCIDIPSILRSIRRNTARRRRARK